MVHSGFKGIWLCVCVCSGWTLTIWMNFLFLCWTLVMTSKMIGSNRKRLLIRSVRYLLVSSPQSVFVLSSLFCRLLFCAGQRVSQDALTSTTNHSKHQNQHTGQPFPPPIFLCVFSNEIVTMYIFFVAQMSIFSGHYHVGRSYLKSCIYASDFFHTMSWMHHHGLFYN